MAYFSTIELQICVHFGIDSVKKNLVANRRNRSIERYGEKGQLFMPNVALIRFVCLAVFLLRSFNSCLLCLFIYFLLPYKMVK